MTAGELFNVFKQNNIPNDAVLMSDSSWEMDATDMDGIYYNKETNTVVFTPKFGNYDRFSYSESPDWIALRVESEE